VEDGTGLQHASQQDSSMKELPQVTKTEKEQDPYITNDKMQKKLI